MAERPTGRRPGPDDGWRGPTRLAALQGTLCALMHLVVLAQWWVQWSLRDDVARYAVEPVPPSGSAWLLVGATGSALGVVGSLALAAWGAAGLVHRRKPARRGLVVALVGATAALGLGVTVPVAGAFGASLGDRTLLVLVWSGVLVFFSLVLLLWTAAVWLWKPAQPIGEAHGRMGSRPTP
ncbi:hypothetical protein [Nocardioides solisilvae]|uniref:hypothetical protein n=1 Tax=Nocardioides solisilvae TaxID=1542435 RepID=UPI0013A536EE|nr:hypothetical protein [Nocardioides solisilvae]